MPTFANGFKRMIIGKQYWDWKCFIFYRYWGSIVFWFRTKRYFILIFILIFSIFFFDSITIFDPNFVVSTLRQPFFHLLRACGTAFFNQSVYIFTWSAH